MNGDPLLERASRLRDAAFALRDALEAGDPARLDAALAHRNEAFAAVAASAQTPLSAASEALVREVLGIDREIEQKLREALDHVSRELAEVRHARAVAGRQQSRAEAPRYVSRRA